MANNNYPQITSVTSEALQAQIRTLLPSQEGFGTDLMAQNVIVPIIDLTSAAEGSTVPQYLQTALAFGSQTTFVFNNNSGVIANTTGFWRLKLNMAVTSNSGSVDNVQLRMSDGLSTKTIYEMIGGTGATGYASIDLDFTVFLAAGESISGSTNASTTFMAGSVRQVADVNGVLVNPSGFTPQ